MDFRLKNPDSTSSSSSESSVRLQDWYYQAHSEEAGSESYPWLEWFNSTNLQHNVTSGSGVEAGQLYQTIIQGVLVCLFTTVGGVMLLVFCLIIVQECKGRFHLLDPSFQYQVLCYAL